MTIKPNIIDNLPAAIAWLNAGQLLAYPTESVWGIGCDAYNKEAVMQILDIKQRPIDKGMIVITDDVERIKPLLSCLNETQQHRVFESWKAPHQLATLQATTWLIPLSGLSLQPKQIAIPKWITGRHNSIAVRVIAHPLIKKLCSNIISSQNPYGFIVSTSCNPSGQPPAVTIEDAIDYFGNSAAVAYLNGSTLGYTAPSQIRDALTGQIIR